MPLTPRPRTVARLAGARQQHLATLRYKLGLVPSMFRMGLDSLEIAQRLKLHEAEVYSALHTRRPRRVNEPQRAPYAGASHA